MELRRPSLPVDGILTFEADGSAWTLLFGVNAFVRLEAEVEPEEVERLIANGEQKPTLETYRAAFWAALRDYHPNLTFEDAGHLMMHVGMQRAGSLIAQAMLAATPQPEDGLDRPRKAARRTRRKLRA